MGAMRQQQFAPPEPSDEEIKDAIWVVIGQSARMSQFGPPPSIAGKVKEHLDGGGSALILGDIQGDTFADALAPWGIKLRTDAVAVHEVVTGGSDSPDFVEQAQRRPVIFILHKYGDHFLTRSVDPLEGVLLPMVVVQTEKKPDRMVMPIIPIPQALKTWGETSIPDLQENKVKYDAGRDLDPPLWAGAVSEKTGGGRVVVVGCIGFIADGLLTYPDENEAKRGLLVSRFPANGELFMNSIFWLARQETMISISASALEVNRVGEISSGVLTFWRVGVLIVALPGLVIAAGIWMFFNRRD
jgi:hypothetical protein